MFKSTLIAILFFVPVFAYAETIPFTSGQVGTDATLTIETDGFKFSTTDIDVSSEIFYLDNHIAGSGTSVPHTVWYTNDFTGCTYGPFMRLQWGGASSINTSTTLDTGGATSTSETESSGTTESEYWRFYHGGCDSGSFITVHKLQVGDTVVFDYLPSEEEESAVSIMLPPMQTISLLGTTSCTGTSTSSVCTYEYSTTSATSTEAQYLGYILQHLKNAFIYAVWLTTFLLVLGVLLLFMRTRYGHY